MLLHKDALVRVFAVGVFLLPACGGGSAAPSNVPALVTAVASPTASPAGGQTAPAALLSWSNGAQIPASFAAADFGALGPLHQQLSVSPLLDGYSTKYISYYFAGNASEFEVGWIDNGENQGQYDYNFPIFIAATSDPLVTIFCNNVITAPCLDGGVHIHMPTLARQAGGTDHHLAVLEPNGLEYDFWLVTSNPPYRNGSSFSAAGEGHYSRAGSDFGANFVAPGFDVGSATAAGIALSGAQIYTSELAAGVINHALAVIFPCSTNAWVYPASQATGLCANGAGMPLGSRVWWQPADAQTNAMAVSHDMKTVLVALHHYGAFFTNNGAGSVNINGIGGGMGAHVENQEPYWIYGRGVDPALNYAANSPSWLHITVAGGLDRYLLTSSGTSLNFLHNLKVVAPCVTQKTC